MNEKNRKYPYDEKCKQTADFVHNAVRIPWVFLIVKIFYGETIILKEEI
jgi:hypothetical protein